MFGAEINDGWVELCVETYLNQTDKDGIDPDVKVMMVQNLLNFSVAFSALIRVRMELMLVEKVRHVP